MLEDLQFYTYRKCFFPLDSSNPEDSDYFLLGIPFDSTQTGMTGSRNGPSSIRMASFELELYDIETRLDLSKVAIYDIGDIDCIPGSPEKTYERILHTIKNIPSNKTLITLGGEHSITYPIAKELKVDRVVSFDAHPDLRNSYMGVELSHSSVMRRLHEVGIDIDVIGVREGSREEAEYANENQIPLIPPLDMKDYKVPSNEDLYISIDLDVFDNLAVGNPVPGGIDFNQFLILLKDIISVSYTHLRAHET